MLEIFAFRWRLGVLALTLAASLGSFPGSVADSAVDLVNAKYRAMVVTLAREMEARLGDRLGEVLAGCSAGCSYHLCGNHFPEEGRMCVDMGTPQGVDCAGDTGRCGLLMLNPHESSVQTPSKLQEKDPELARAVATDICVTQGIEGVLMEATNFTGGPLGFPAWMYMGFVRSGVFRSWPLKPTGRDNSSCNFYDPRLRPWYKVATSEPKNVVIIIQASGTMRHGLRQGGGRERQTRWDVAKAAANKLLQTFDAVNDHVNVVAFNGTAWPLMGKGLLKADDGVIGDLMAGLDNVTLGGRSDNQAALDIAFDLFEETFRSEEGDIPSRCQNVIILLGDGSDCKVSGQDCLVDAEGSGGAYNGVMTVLAGVELRQERLEKDFSSRAAIFPATVEGGDDGLPRQLACRNGGVWTTLTGRAEPLNDMEAYFQYLGFSMEPRSDNQEPPITWVPLYTDQGGLGKMTTMVYPLFAAPKCLNGATGNGKVLVAVIGKDVTLRMLEEDGLNEVQASSMIDKNLGEVRLCNEGYNYSTCKLQAIRKSSAECPTTSFTSQEGPPTSNSGKCFLLNNTHYLLRTDPIEFQDAASECKNQGGRLAELIAQDLLDQEAPGYLQDLEVAGVQQHFLGAASPPDGAWIGLQPEGTESGRRDWVWIGSRKKVVDPQSWLWHTEPQKNRACIGGFVDPRGTLRNVDARACQEKTAYWCEFATGIQALPVACMSSPTEVRQEEVMETTTARCIETETCAISGSLDSHLVDLSKVTCDPGEYQDDPSLLCCSEEDARALYPGKCDILPNTSSALQDDASIVSVGKLAEKTEDSDSGGLHFAKPTLIAIISTPLGVAFVVAASTIFFVRHRYSNGRTQYPKAQKSTGHVENADNCPSTTPTALKQDLSRHTASGEKRQSQASAENTALCSSRRFLESDAERVTSSSSMHLDSSGDGSHGPIFSSPFEAVSKEPRKRLSFRPAARVDLWAAPIVPIENVITIEVGGWEGKGSHGSVREAVWLDDNRKAHKVAVKSARDLAEDAGVGAIKREFEILAGLPRHPNIVWVIGGRMDDDPIIVEEWMPANLADVLHDDRPGLTYLQIIKIGLDVARGLLHLHVHDVVHHDVKPQNILLDQDMNAKIADFTCSRLKMAATMSVHQKGTLGYMAPECFAEGIRARRLHSQAPRVHVPKEKIDVYSFGKVLLECVTGGLDLGDAREDRGCPSCLVDLILGCTRPAPEERHTLEGVVQDLEEMVGESWWGGGRDWRNGVPKNEVWKNCLP